MCDHAQNTITVVRTQYDKIIGGFSGYPWNSAYNTLTGGEDKDAFLFSLDDNKKYYPVGPVDLIMCYRGYGPTFGIGHDLCLTDRCHKLPGSYANFPMTFNSRKRKIERSQNSFTQFSGALEDNWFLVKEYEVFEVIF